MSEEGAPIYSPFFGVMGAASAMVFSAMGAAYGTAKSGTGISAMAVMRPGNGIPLFPWLLMKRHCYIRIAVLRLCCLKY